LLPSAGLLLRQNQSAVINDSLYKYASYDELFETPAITMRESSSSRLKLRYYAIDNVTSGSLSTSLNILEEKVSMEKLFNCQNISDQDD